ncbi:MAG TPA: SDR family oxidoreductase [Gemmataceae bacterium]|nr:SDR family oxidoreductase [Gemmataceae bacterium]
MTGAGSGIGKATAILLAQQGAKVIVSDINVEAAEKVVGEIRQISANSEAARLDVADEKGWKVVIDMILLRYRRLDVLVNNAGVSFAKSVAEMTLEEWRGVLSVNLDGVFLGTKHAIRAMRTGNGGSIINVASASGVKAFPQASAYGASKAAVRLLSRVAAIECANARTGIRVNVVTPSGVRTPMWETMDFFKQLIVQHGGTQEAFSAMAGNSGSQQFFTPDEVARTIVYLASDESSHLNGVEIVMAQGHVA